MFIDYFDKNNKNVLIFTQNDSHKVSYDVMHNSKRKNQNLTFRNPVQKKYTIKIKFIFRNQ